MTISINTYDEKELTFEHVPKAFTNKLNKQRVLEMERYLGIKFNKSEVFTNDVNLNGKYHD